MKPICIILIIIILAVLGVGAYELWPKKGQGIDPGIFIENKAIDKTADWRVYRNDQQGYAIKYPRNWNYSNKKKQTDDMLLSYTIFQKDKIDRSESDLSDSVIIMVENRSFEEARSIMGYEPLIAPIKETEILMDEVKSVKQVGKLKSGITETRILIPKNEKVYTLIYNNGPKEAIQILSTFRFLE